MNFAGGVNPTADPTAEYPDEVWYFDRVRSRDGSHVAWELVSPFDLEDVMLPARQVRNAIAQVCEELLMNALYDAPIGDVTGETRRAFAVHRDPTVLPRAIKGKPSADNRALIGGWAGAWMDRAQAALAPVARLALGEHGESTLAEVRAELDARCKKAGLGA